MNETNGWTEFDNSRDTYLRKYKNQMAVVVGKGKHPSFYLTDEVMKVLGNPVRVKVFVRGNNVGLLGTKEGGYVVNYNKKATLPSIVATKFCREFGVIAGAYSAMRDGNMIVFDMKQVPSRL